MSLSLYEILQVPPKASPEDIRCAYRALLLRLHPDKRSSSNSNRNEADQVQGDQSELLAGQQQQQLDEFHKVQHAFEVLSDPDRREAHDRELSHAEMRSVLTFQDELLVEDMELQADGQGSECYTYECRCGDVYWLAVKEMQAAAQAAIAVPCRSCSNHILVRAKS